MMRGSRPRHEGAAALVLLPALVLLAGCQANGPSASEAQPVAAEAAAPRLVTALGRLEPKDGIIKIAGSSRTSVVIAKLLVEEGDRVEVDQPLAELDTLIENQARVTRARAELKNAEIELARVQPLVRQRIVADTERDRVQTRVDVAKADLVAAQAALGLDIIRAPVAGQIIEIHARRGERIGPAGFAELAQNDQMYAVAEVYETDIGRVKLGQRAVMRSPAFTPELTGTVDLVGMKIGRLDVLSADPIAATDARVVEVRIKLDDSPRAAALSNLQVEVAINSTEGPRTED